MGKVLLVFVVAVVAYYAHGVTIFSEDSMLDWAVHEDVRAVSEPNEACEDFLPDAVVEVNGRDENGPVALKGGKADMCGYMLAANVAMRALQANGHSDISEFHVKRGGFPWTTATLTYKDTTTISSPRLPQTITSVSIETVVVKRTFGGIKIKHLTSNEEPSGPH